MGHKFPTPPPTEPENGLPPPPPPPPPKRLDASLLPSLRRKNGKSRLAAELYEIEAHEDGFNDE